MSKKEICSYFLRGSCKFGDRCKNLHVPPSQQQQQPKANGFNFGTQRQQQPNPFGFGVKSGSQPGGLMDSGSRYNQNKPFENKWSRPSPSTNASSQRQSDSQPATEHDCTDAKSCQSLVAEDSKERPLWKLTCYAHYKYLPCDISGDVSYEELRAAAYEDAKRGLNLQAIAERDRVLVSSKLAEFDNLGRNPLSAATPNAFSMGTSNANPPVVSSFSQAAMLTANTGARPSEPSGAFFGSSSSFTNPANAFGSNSLQSASAFGSNNLQSASTFGSNSLQSGSAFGSNSLQSASVFGSNSLQSSSSGSNTFQFPTTQMNGNSQGSSTPSFNTSGAFGSASNTFPAPSFSPQLLSTTSHQPTSGFGLTADKTFTSAHSSSNTPQSSDSSRDTSIWMKDEWLPGEIPEEAPPNELVF